jgi:hypothetical protein
LINGSKRGRDSETASVHKPGEESLYRSEYEPGNSAIEELSVAVVEGVDFQVE